ncbi:MAG: hypothetical protein HN350_21715 [Phycisphaerales bacterium]|nr:hypothetical protein [Phycisphaerales bacterium]
MQRMVYYPGFEVANSTWLKFALLYINTLRPIIPPNGYNYLSNQHRMLKEETDLIVPLDPNLREASRATKDAILVIEKVLENPRLYPRTFSIVKGGVKL